MILVVPSGGLYINMFFSLDISGYKSDDELAHDIENLVQFGELNKITGEFDFVKCTNCNGPLFGHKETEENCAKKTRAKKFKDTDSSILMDHFRNLTCFKYKLLTLDTRKSQTYCDLCNKSMANRLDFIMHMESTHKVKVGVHGVCDSADSVSNNQI